MKLSIHKISPRESTMANMQMPLIWPATSGEFFGEGNLLFILQIYHFIIASYWKY